MVGIAVGGVAVVSTVSTVVSTVVSVGMTVVAIPGISSSISSRLGIGFSISRPLPVSVAIVSTITIESTVVSTVSTIVGRMTVVSIPSVSSGIGIGLRLSHDGGKSESYDEQDFHGCDLVLNCSKTESPC